MGRERSALGPSLRHRGRITVIAGWSLATLGLLLLLGVGLYYGYGVYAGSRSDELNYAVQAPPSLPADAVREGFTSPDLARLARDSTRNQDNEVSRPLRPVVTESYESQQPSTAKASTSTETAPQAEQAEQSKIFRVSDYPFLYPGVQLHPKYWDRPLWAGTDLRPGIGLPENFRLTSASNRPGRLSGNPALRIRIAAIGVDSDVKELGILDLGDSREYETPKNTVGHIPETANPGLLGNGWFFGHLESPIKGEGSVFRNLPEIPERLRNGDPVYIRFGTEDGEYLYQVTRTHLVHEDDLSLYESEEAAVTLVTCYPRLRYDYRLIVTARLVGVKG